MAILGPAASDDVIRWLESWAGEVSNTALASFAFVTLLIRRPFTLVYAISAVFAVEFTEFNPDYAGAKFSQSIGEAADPPESLARLVDWLPPFILVTGIVGWVSDAIPDLLGITLIVVGVVGSALLRKTQKVKT